MICLIDNYDSFTYNLAQYLSTFTDVQVVRNDHADLENLANQADGLVFSPGPGWPKDAGRMEEMIAQYAGKKPILGICLGHQAIAEVFGGQLAVANQIMHGKESQMLIEVYSPIFEELDNELTVMRYHSIAISKMPVGFDIVAKTLDDHEIMAIQNLSKNIFGLQYHPESIGTSQGLKMIENFVALVDKQKG